MDSTLENCQTDFALSEMFVCLMLNGVCALSKRVMSTHVHPSVSRVCCMKTNQRIAVN